MGRWPNGLGRRQQLSAETGATLNRATDRLAPIFETFKAHARFLEEEAEAEAADYKKVRYRKMALWSRLLSDSNNAFSRKAFTELVKRDKKLIENQRPLLVILRPVAIDTRTTEVRYGAVRALVKKLRAVTKLLRDEGAVTHIQASVFDLLCTVEYADLKRRSSVDPSRRGSNWLAKDDRFSLTMQEFLVMYANWIEEFKIPESDVYVKSGKEVLGDNLIAAAFREKEHRSLSPEVVAFCRYLTPEFERQYGQKLPTVIANLANAIFSPDTEISADNVKAMIPGLDKRPPHKSRQRQ